MFPEDRMMEVVLIGALALIVIGPKDLPIAMRKLGQFIGKMRGMAAEFRASFDEMARQSELDELRKEVEALRTGRDSLTSAFNPLADPKLKSTMSEINQHLGSGAPGPQMTALPSPSPVVEPAAADTSAADAPAPAAPERPKAARKSAGPAADPSRPKAGAKPADKAASPSS